VVAIQEESIRAACSAPATVGNAADPDSFVAQVLGNGIYELGMRSDFRVNAFPVAKAST